MTDTPLLTLLALAAFLRRRLLRSIAPSSFPSLGAMMADMLPGEELVARTLRDGQLLGFLEGGTELVKALPAAKHESPPATTRALPAPFELELPGLGSRPPEPPEVMFPDRPGDPAPAARFPAIEKAANYLRNRIAYTPAEFRMLDDEARDVGFTVAKTLSLDAVEKVRDALAEEVEKGGSLRAFRKRIAGVIEESALAPHHVEAIFRTQLAKAHSYGQRSVISHPLIADQFPYILYSFVGDSRTRDEHIYLGTHGLNDTGVYRADDPFWDTWWPPCGWNCRCMAIPLDLPSAARHGVREAIEWMRTGIPPANPEYTPPPPFTIPPGWSPSGGGLRSVL